MIDFMVIEKSVVYVNENMIIPIQMIGEMNTTQYVFTVGKI
jgi:hypothetical protein